MQLNLPILSHLANSKSILIAGMGGGFDVFCGLPLYFELEKLGYDVHLASLSFSDLESLNEGEELTDTLIGITGDTEEVHDYFPEYYLAQWFYNERNEDITIWCFEKTGARPLIKNYAALVKHLGIDAILLVDGGVDSLMRGDEPEPGTMFEDSLSLLAVNELQSVPVKLIACLGLGIELEIGYSHLFENIANLTQIGAFKGSCSLLKDMESYARFEEAVLDVFDQQSEYPSVICSSVIAAVRGNYGNYHLTKRTQGSTLRVSPLMPIYWFFDAQTVAKQNTLIPHLRLTWSVDEAWSEMQKARSAVSFRPMPEYPLP
ncbi:MAG: DUF1152 domain-containing protein [Burkholderiales bacterium]|nr:DUF1152 domain-containing protein [Anaerolineae bacterium]